MNATQPMRLLRPGTLRYCELATLKVQQGFLPIPLDLELERLGRDIDRLGDLEMAYDGVERPSLTPDEVDELARIDHSKRHGFPSPHEL